MTKNILDPPQRPLSAELFGRYIVTFRDDGQDFLRWHLDTEGRVLRSEPFQTWRWSQYRIVNLRELLLWAESDRAHPGAHAKPLAQVTHVTERIFDFTTIRTIPHDVTSIEVLPWPRT